jgi:hypothetical protein
MFESLATAAFQHTRDPSQVTSYDKLSLESQMGTTRNGFSDLVIFRALVFRFWFTLT